jgi:hypothetical protein
MTAAWTNPRDMATVTKADRALNCMFWKKVGGVAEGLISGILDLDR